MTKIKTMQKLAVAALFVVLGGVSLIFGLGNVHAASAAEVTYDSEDSNIVTYAVEQLATPVVSLGDMIDGFPVAQFNSVPNATSYYREVYTSFPTTSPSMTGNCPPEKIIVEGNITKFKFNNGDLQGQPPANGKIYTLRFRANGNGSTYANSAISEKFTFMQCTTTMNLTGTLMSWDTSAFTSVTKLELICGSEVKDVTGQSSYDISTFTSLTPNTHNFRLRASAVVSGVNIAITSPVGNGYVSELSVTITKLASPVISLSGSTLSWSAVPNASGYRVYYNNTSKDTTATSIDLAPLIGENVGSYNVKVRAIGNISPVVPASLPMQMVSYVYNATKAKYTVTVFDGGDLTSIEVEEGDKLPTDELEKEGFTLKLFTDAEKTKAFALTTAIDKNMTLYAEYTEIAGEDKDNWFMTLGGGLTTAGIGLLVLVGLVLFLVFRKK